MKTLIVASAFAGLLALALVEPSEGAQITSPVIFGNHFQDHAECVVLNAGTRPLAVTVKIVDDTGQTRGTSTCDGALGVGEFCSAVAGIDFRNSFACVATAPSTANLRGTLVLEETVFDDFFVAQLHPIRSAPLR